MTKGARESRSSTVAKMVYFVFLTACFGYTGMKLVPPVLTSFRFAQTMQDEVLYGPVNEPASTIHLRLVRKARRLGLDVSPEAIVVHKRGATLDISARYTARIELFGRFDIDWPLDQHYEGTRRPPAIGGHGP